MSSNFPAGYRPPLVIVAAAVLVALAALFLRPEAKAVSVPLDLKAGAVQAVEFRPGYSKTYEIGVEMEQQAASRLFPCMADSTAPTFGKCKPGEFPLALSLTLVAKGAESPSHIQPNTSTGGGHYSGVETFTRGAGSAYLSAGRIYRLTVRSLADGTALAAVRPRLVVELHPLDRKEEMAKRLLAAAFALVFAVVGAAWAVVIYVRSRGRSAGAARA